MDRCTSGVETTSILKKREKNLKNLKKAFVLVLKVTQIVLKGDNSLLQGILTLSFIFHGTYFMLCLLCVNRGKGLGCCTMVAHAMQVMHSTQVMHSILQHISLYEGNT